ncbi:hypothetical protein E2C01_044886 [Portunus trituberculatus]|uniref:Uncharacterized protein n=1 Tax=Portunus trituberculatus TaxID=210409 RepID=A0A5B7G0N2_PORTR|nr:hypothetical protein [Portunus trituberculatus]
MKHSRKPCSALPPSTISILRGALCVAFRRAFVVGTPAFIHLVPKGEVKVLQKARLVGRPSEAQPDRSQKLDGYVR